MKTKDIAKEYGINQADFEQYLKKVGANCKFGFIGATLEDDIQGHVQRYKIYDAEEKAKQANERKKAAEEAERRRQAEMELERKKRQAEEEKREALSSMLITSGFNFDGYKITKYSGYISGDDAISIDRGTSGIFSSATDVNEELTKSLVKIRRNAIQELKEAAYDLGCNAVIGVDFDYITLDPETANSSGGTTYLPYVFCVTANGNAVVIEKDRD